MSLKATRGFSIELGQNEKDTERYTWCDDPEDVVIESPQLIGLPRAATVEEERSLPIKIKWSSS